MVFLPPRIKETLTTLRKSYVHYLQVKLIKGQYCVFECNTAYIKELKRRKKTTHYIGRILSNGEFMKAKHREPKAAKGPQLEQREIKLTREELAVLRTISMNGRATALTLSKISGLSRSAAYETVRRLESRFGIQYMPEIDVEKLGYLRFLVLIKFLDRVPTAEEINEAVKKEPQIQLAFMLTGGEYDVLLYIIAESNYELNKINVLSWRDTLLIKYPARWYTTTFFQHNGFVPLRDSFISIFDRSAKKRGLDVILGDKPSDKKKQMLTREFAVLKELNADGSQNFAEIDKKYGFDRGRSQYSYYKLTEKGLLKGITISMERLPIKYIVVLFVEITDYSEFEKTRPVYLHDIIQETDAPINKYSLVGDIGIPYGSIFFMPVFNESELEQTRIRLSRVKGIRVREAVVTQTVYGKLCFRLYDNAYSMQQQVLIDRYKESPPERRNYGEI